MNKNAYFCLVLTDLHESSYSQNSYKIKLSCDTNQNAFGTKKQTTKNTHNNSAGCFLECKQCENVADN